MTTPSPMSRSTRDDRAEETEEGELLAHSGVSAGADGNWMVAGWPPTAERLLRGLAHELSNRIGTIGAAAEALRAADPASRIAGMLASEATRLEALLRLLRLLTTEGDAAPEPVRPADLLADAVALLALHPDVRETAIVVEGGDEAPPVRVRVPALVRAVVVLLEAQARAANGGALVVRCAPDGDTLVVGVAPAAADSAAGPDPAAVAAAAALVAPDGGTVTVGPPGAGAGAGTTLRLPTLAALRRAERATPTS